MKDITIETSEDGTVAYTVCYRRDNIFLGDETWCYEGVRHRDDGSAVKDR